MVDYIPGPDARFQSWLDNFVTYASANLGLVVGNLTVITTTLTAWDGKAGSIGPLQPTSPRPGRDSNALALARVGDSVSRQDGARMSAPPGQRNKWE